MPTILVQIASYRDSELSKTIESCLDKAAQPNNLRFSIVNQYGPETSRQLDHYRHNPNFRIIEIPWREARGVGVARAKTNQQYAGEDYYLQIDSHMRFESDWDLRLLRQWQACQDEQAILSSYPPAYRYDDQGKEYFVESRPNRLVVHDFYLGKIPTFFGKELPGRPDKPSLAGFASGGLQFGPGRVCLEVPYEPRICFIGEEIIHSLRLYTYGYNIYAPTDQVVSHLYIRTKNQKDSHHFWNDFNQDPKLRQVYQDMNQLSYQLCEQYLTGQYQETLGSQRSLAEFENFAGVDFSAQRIHKDSYFMPDLPMAESAAWKRQAIMAVKQS